MWEQYEPPEEQQAQVTRSSGAGRVIGVVSVLAVIGIGVGIASSAGPDYSGFHECLAAEEVEADSGYLSPADICEIGHDVPPDYVDEYEYDPFEDGYGSGVESGY
ncbi:MAG TPA: hypothetical protein VNT31_00145 [Nocardioides sp.]|nr:hypothetical protein [Nocardioides sp.]